MECGKIKFKRQKAGTYPWKVFFLSSMWMGIRSKPRPARIGEMLRNHKGEVLISFSKPIGVKNSNEAEMWAIFEAMRIYSGSFHESSVVESDSFNDITRV